MTGKAAQPQLPPTIESVFQVINASKALPDPSLVHRLVWPFLISSCMAVKEIRSSFRDLAFAACLDCPSTGTAYTSLSVMEECWRLHDLKKWPVSSDWLTAMRSLGVKVLPV